MKDVTSLVSRITVCFSQNHLEPSKELLAYASSCDEFSLGNLSADDMQNSMCKYLDACASRNQSLSKVLGRTREPPIAETVTEAVNMFVDSITRSDSLRHLNLGVTSEKTVKLPSGKYIKPDVGIWQKDQERLLATVECKTCLGYQRKTWMIDYEKRVADFASVGVSQSASILFVGTENTWGGFPKNDPRYRKTWFSLCPVGSWYGGGVNKEVPLLQLQHNGTLQGMFDAVVASCTR